MTDTLNNDQKLKLLSRCIDLMLGNGGLSGQGITELYKELHGLIEPEQDNGVIPEMDDVMRPWLFACNNGEVDLKSGGFNKGVDTQALERRSLTNWKGFQFRCFLWRQTLLDCFGGDQAMVDRFQRECGSALIGEFNESKIIVLQGVSRNGKSLILRTLAQAMGSYSKSFGTELFHAESKINLYNLHGVRMALVIGGCTGCDPATIKQLCSGDTLFGWNPDADRGVSFRPSHTFFLDTNSSLDRFADDPGMAARLKVFPMKTQFLESEALRKGERRADPHLAVKLTEELPGILAWLVEGCLAWQREQGGLTTDCSGIEKAFLHLFDTTGSFIQHAGAPFSKDDCFVNMDHINDLNAAYQDVYQALESGTLN